MKKGICFMMTAVLCAMLLTACGNNSGQSDNAGAQNQSESNSTVQGSETDNQDNEVISGTEVQQEAADAAEAGQEAEGTENGPQDTVDHTDGQTGKVLVVYYSASGNTKAVADAIAQYTDGDTFEIVPVEAYTNEDLNWGQEGSRVNREHDDESLQDIALVTTTVEDFDSYDTIFIGYPIWWHEAAWVVNNFVKDNDFTGKTVIPFCTSSSSGLGESGVHLAEMAGTGDWQEGMRFSGSASESEVTEWLEGLDL